MTLPLKGIKIIDFTHVQAGPACTQLLAWFGADVIKVERPGSGDVTRTQLRDIPDVDALYFTMLNSNKRSLTLDTKKPEGKKILEQLIRESDVLVENFGPGALDRMGFSWERINELNPKMIVASVKGFSDGHHYEDLKVYENVAQCAGGAASTTGFWDGPPTVSAAALGDSNTGMHLAIGILTAIIGRQQTGKGQKVAVSMQDAVLNLCRVKLRDQQRLDRLGFLEEYPQYPHGEFSDVVPRGGNAGGGGQPGWVLKCKAGRPTRTRTSTSPSRAMPGSRSARRSASPNGSATRTTARPSTPAAYLRYLQDHRGMAGRQDQVRSRGYPAQVDIPCSPVLSMKEIANDPSLRASGSITEVAHKERGTYLTVGSPIKFSDLKPEITGSPLLGEHSDEVLAGLGYAAEDIKRLRESAVI